MIYDVDLVLGWIRDGNISVDVAEMFAIDFVQERARELGKVDLWRDPWHYDGVDDGVCDESPEFVMVDAHAHNVPAF